MVTDGAQPERRIIEDESASRRKDGLGAAIRMMVAKWMDVITARVPAGYEDETGFHCGT